MEAKQYKLKWNNFQINMLKEFESMHNSQELADVTLTCEGINMKAHKFILSASSPYFRTVFKENPCSHPIVILKDIYYVDLMAIIKYMYHGEVMVSEDNLPSFLETAAILQVSGLSDNRRSPQTRNKHRNDKPPPLIESPAKRLKKTTPEVPPLAPKPDPPQPSSPPAVSVENIKSEVDDSLDDDDGTVGNNNDEDDEEDGLERADGGPLSILEAALEVRDKPCASILERSLMSSNPTDKGFVAGEVPKAVFIPRKPPEVEFDVNQIRSSPESSCPSDRQGSVKVENEDLYEMIEITSPEDIRTCQQQHNQFYAHKMANSGEPSDIQPHHSSQCGTCPHCGKVYSNQSALKYHVRLVHSDMTNTFCCHLCPESFDYREGYKKHMADVHLMRN